MDQEVDINSQSQFQPQEQFQHQLQLLYQLIRIWYSLDSIKLSNTRTKSLEHQNLLNLMTIMLTYQTAMMQELHISLLDQGILIVFLVILLTLILHLVAQC